MSHYLTKTSAFVGKSQLNKISPILDEALLAVDPYHAISRMIQRKGNVLTVAGQAYSLDRYQRVFIIGLGKAVYAMAKGLSEIVEDKLAGGAIVVKHMPEVGNQLPKSIRIFTGSHPVPDEKSIEATQKVIESIYSCEKGDLVFCLISGGGSALFTNPVVGVQLSELQEMTRLLLACGADIYEINTLRKHLDTVKGGGLARRVFPADLITLILSDVMGSPLDIIASGPTVADSSSYGDALAVLQKYQLIDKIPISIRKILQDGENGLIPETVKQNDPCLENVQNVLIASNNIAAEAAIKQAQKEGFNTMLLTTYLQGEAQEVGIVLGGILKQIAETGQPIQRPACLVAGGETTVTLKGNGLGGRNQEVALGAVTTIAGLKDVAIISLATDGEDGPTNAAGGVVTGETYERGKKMGLSPQEFLQRNDSFHYLETSGNLVVPGVTGTNVNDLTFLFAF